MKDIRILISIITLLIAGFTANAQEYKELWLVGSAVPGSAQKMEKTPDGYFRYNGALSVGSLKVQTTSIVTADTEWLVPQAEDAQAINHGINYLSSTDSASSSIYVPIPSSHYRLTVSPQKGKINGEIFRPWHELYLVGGATPNGWDVYNAISLTQDENNPYLWSWTGELKPHSEYVGASEFKFLGFRTYGQREIHPFYANADVLKTTKVRPLTGVDTKWVLRKPGRYHITLDLFHETIKAKYLGE